MAVAALFTLLVITPLPAAGTGIDHGSVVGPTPRTNTPQVLDGEVYAGLQVGNRIIVGGDFDQLEDAALGTITQPYLAAYDVDTGRLDTNFLPDLDDYVRSIADAGDGTIVIVGQFRTINGISRNRVARIRLVDGSVVKSFATNANAQVLDVAVAGDRAFLGGTFSTVNGQPRERLAAVDLHTGELDEGFDLPVTGATGYDGASSVRGVDVSPDGTTLATVHNDAFVDGFARQGVALIDISSDVATVLPWQTSTYDYDCQPWFPEFTRPLMRDVQFSPDGSYIMVVSAIGNYSPGCDSAVRLPTTGGPGVQPDWVSRLFDSPEAVAITDDAVYVGGHMRWAMAPGTVWTDFSDGNTDEQPDGTVVRDQILALSPTDGTALEWDPGASGFRGVLALRATQAGLLAGSDGDRFGGEIIGRHAFFELPATVPPPDASPPDATFRVPGDGSVVGTTFPVIVEANDDSGVGDIALTIQHDASGAYLQLDGSFGPAAADLSPLVLDTATTDATLIARSTLAPGAYTAVATTVDLAGTPDPTPATASFTVNGGAGSTPPDGRLEHPDADEVIPGPVTLSGVAWDDSGIDKVRLIIRNLDTGDYMQNDGSFAPGFNRMYVSPEDRGATTTFWSWSRTLPDGRYRARLHLKDLDNTADPVKDKVVFRVEAVSDTAAPDATIDVPLNKAVIDAFPTTFEGTASDDRGLREVVLIIRNAATNEYLQPDGSLAPTWATLATTLDSPGASSSAWAWTGTIPPGEYRVRARAEDLVGTLDPTKPRVTVTVPAR